MIAEYGFKKASIKVNEIEAIFQPRAKIRDRLLIEYEDINANRNRIDISLKIEDEGAAIFFSFYKENGRWKYLYPIIYVK